MGSLFLLFIVCGDGGYKPAPTVIYFDYVVVQDYLELEEPLLIRTIVGKRILHLLNWYDDVGFVYEGWILIQRDRYPYNKQYQFFEKFKGKWWEIRMDVLDYEMSERDLEDFYIRKPRRTRLKESRS